MLEGVSLPVVAYRADNVDSRGGATYNSLSIALRSINEVAVADELSEFINDCISN